MLVTREKRSPDCDVTARNASTPRRTRRISFFFYNTQNVKYISKTSVY